MSAELSWHGHLLTGVSTGARAIALRDSADVLLLNLDLPDLDGIEVCRRIRSVSDAPMMGLLPHDNPTERVLALRAGLDVCLPPDCRSAEIAARIRAVTRRFYGDATPVPLTSGALQIDPVARQVRLHGRRVQLTPKEFDLLHLLASRPGEVLNRRHILAEIWDDQHGWMTGSRTIDTHVNSLRRKLDWAPFIETQRGIGFRFLPL